MSGVDDSHLSRWYGTSQLNRTQVLAMNYVYDVPAFKNASNHVLKGIFGGSQISGITSFFTGQPIDFGCGIAGFSSGIGEGVRCNTLGPLKINKGVSNDPLFGTHRHLVRPQRFGSAVSIPALCKWTARHVRLSGI